MTLSCWNYNDELSRWAEKEVSWEDKDVHTQGALKKSQEPVQRRMIQTLGEWEQWLRLSQRTDQWSGEGRLEVSSLQVNTRRAEFWKLIGAEVINEWAVDGRWLQGTVRGKFFFFYYTVCLFQRTIGIKKPTKFEVLLDWHNDLFIFEIVHNYSTSSSAVILPNPPVYPSLLSLKFMASFFVNCYCMHICIHMYF